MPTTTTKATAQVRFDGAMPDDLFPHIATHVREADLLAEETEDRLIVRTPDARVDLHRAGPILTVGITAQDAVILQNIREYLIYILDRAAPGLTDSGTWQGDIARDNRPPNFALARFCRSWRVAPNFIRVELACDDTRRLAEGKGMHFSLLLPPEGRDPVWLTLDDRGRTLWPSGADALHRAPYTFVDLDVATGRFTFDVFEHEGGRVTTWATTATPGTEVGITGPGSGTFPTGTAMLMAGDETALPAMRRILAASPADRHGSVFIEVGSAADICDLPRPDGMALTWVLRSRGDTLWDHLSRIDAPEGPDRHVWIAAEKDLVRRAKSRFRGDQGVGIDESYMAYYWSA